MLAQPRRERDLQKLLAKLGLDEGAIAAVNWSLLDLALTHPSVAKTENYEQLEFLGDAVARLVAAEVLLETYPQASVGEFAAVRSVLVSDRVLAEFAQQFGLERYVVMTSSVAADRLGERSRLADAFEAVLGALYLSTGTMKLIRPWLDPLLAEKAAEVYRDPARQNYKDALQEWTQAQHKCLPQYRTQFNEPARVESERFIAEVWLQEQCLGVGTGRSKKAAEQAAAKVAFLAIVSPQTG